MYAQHPPANINILGASDFGYLVICLPNTLAQIHKLVILHQVLLFLKMQKELTEILEITRLRVT